MSIFKTFKKPLFYARERLKSGPHLITRILSLFTFITIAMNLIIETNDKKWRSIRAEVHEGNNHSMIHHDSVKSLGLKTHPTLQQFHLENPTGGWEVAVRFAVIKIHLPFQGLEPLDGAALVVSSNGFEGLVIGAILKEKYRDRISRVRRFNPTSGAVFSKL